MRRRVLLAAVATTAAALAGPAGFAQGGPKTARIAVLSGLSEDDPATQARLAAFREGMAKAGWREGENLSIDQRFSPSSEERARQLVVELLAAKPDVVLAQGPAVASLQQATRTVPIVFVVVSDPVGAKFVESLAHPGANLTGFTSTEPAFGSKWIEFLKEIAPGLQRVGVLAHNNVTFYRPNLEEAARRLGLELSYVQIDRLADVEPAIVTLAARPNGGMVLPTDALTATYRKPIIELALRHRLPLITGNQPFPYDGGLMYYGADIVDTYRQSAGYIDRILRGARPADLPVQQPSTFKLVINLKTAAALGLTVPSVLRALADEVVE